MRLSTVFILLAFCCYAFIAFKLIKMHRVYSKGRRVMYLRNEFSPVITAIMICMGLACLVLGLSYIIEGDSENTKIMPAIWYLPLFLSLLTGSTSAVYLGEESFIFNAKEYRYDDVESVEPDPYSMPNVVNVKLRNGTVLYMNTTQEKEKSLKEALMCGRV